ncbi:MAG: CsbD family protein [Gemmatimonadota bacterium]
MSQEGKKDQVSGRLKEAAGALLDDEDLKQDGKLDKAAGELKETVGRGIDRVKNAVKGDDD